MITVSRRRFLALTGGLLATGCTSSRSSSPPLSPDAPPVESAAPPTSPSSPALPATAEVTSVTTPTELSNDGHVLVLLEMRGGNDAVNTLPPMTGAYRDLRPTIALPEDDLVAVTAFAGHSLHPSLAPLTPFAETGRLAAIAGIGFPEPNRSHFVSLDRWARADRLDATAGWLGRWLDGLPDDLSTLGATTLGRSDGGDVLVGSVRRGTVIDDVNTFEFPAEISNSTIRLLGAPLSDDPLFASAQRAFVDAVGSVEEFDAIADSVRSRVQPTDEDSLGQPAGAFATGLAVAAEMIMSDVGTRVVTVSAGGFDTHSDQLQTHADLLDDLASGLVSFWATLDEAGESDRVLLASTSEFGRRVQENASAGCDHGAAGVSFVMGNSVMGGLHGLLDTSDLLDGDLRPQIDPRTLFTACLDWLGGDVETILGERHDEVQLLA